MALGKLSLTVPWIGKYLAMMDTVSLRLPYYRQTLELLYYIYKAVNLAPGTLISKQTAALLKSTLDWLFELPNLPKELYPNWQKIHKDKHYVQKNLLLGDSTASVKSTKCNLDRLEIINERTLCVCCPSVGLKTSAPNVKTNLNNYTSNKHITPVSSQLHKSVKTAGVKHLEVSPPSCIHFYCKRYSTY